MARMAYKENVNPGLYGLLKQNGAPAPPAAQRVPLKDPPTTGTPSDALLLQRATGRPPPVPAAGRVEPNTLVTPQYPLQKPASVSEEYRTWSLDQFTGERRQRRERTANSSRS